MNYIVTEGEDALMGRPESAPAPPGGTPTNPLVDAGDGLPAPLQPARQRLPLAPQPRITDLRHSVIHYGKGWYCGHPRQAVFAYFGGGEIVVGHNHAPCAYQVAQDVQHDLGGYHSRAVVLLQRSLDGGETWPPEEDVVVYDETMPTGQKCAFLARASGPRESFRMRRRESVFFFGRTYLPEDRGSTARCFALRSPDKGRTWEKAPTLVTHPDGDHLWVHKDCHPVVPLPDGQTLLAAATLAQPDGPGVYASDDDGLSWRFRSRVGWDRSGRGRHTYAGILLLPDGELHCYSLHICSAGTAVQGTRNAICRFVSRDWGQTWSAPEPIVGEGAGCWRSPGEGGHAYSSPLPILLADGRILVLFARRRPPMGIGGVLSADEGATWSEEFVIRDDGPCDDLGYPVGCQLDDGRIFLAYYTTLADGNGFGGTRHIAGSTFRIADL